VLCDAVTSLICLSEPNGTKLQLLNHQRVVKSTKVNFGQSWTKSQAFQITLEHRVLIGSVYDYSDRFIQGHIQIRTDSIRINHFLTKLKLIQILFGTDSDITEIIRIKRYPKTFFSHF